MKSILQWVVVLICFAASQSWAHSICQYQDSAAQCHDQLECVWTPGANGSGRCVDEKGISKAVLADAVPAWLPLITKSTAIDRFIEWAQPEPLYRITEIQEKPAKFGDGQDGWETVILFSDSKGCVDRKHVTQCGPVAPQGPLICVMSMTDCMGRILRQTTRVSNSF